MPNSIFFQEGRGFESKCVTDTRATTDKNDPFLNWGSNTGKSGWTKMGQNATWGSGVQLKIPQNPKAPKPQSPKTLKPQNPKTLIL